MLRKKILILLLINPLLLIMQFLVGGLTYCKVTNLNKHHNSVIEVRVYLRNNLINLISAESNQRAYILSSHKSYLTRYYKDVAEIKEQVVPAEYKANEWIKLQTHYTGKRLAELERGIVNSERQLSDTALVFTNPEHGWIDSIINGNRIFYDKLNSESEQYEQSEYWWIKVIFCVFITIFLFNILFVALAIWSIKHDMTVLTNLNAALESKNQTMQQLSYKTYHQLREPLRNISGFLKLLLKKHEAVLDDEAKEFIEHSIQATQKLDKEIKELRDRLS